LRHKLRGYKQLGDVLWEDDLLHEDVPVGHTRPTPPLGAFDTRAVTSSVAVDLQHLLVSRLFDMSLVIIFRMWLLCSMRPELKKPRVDGEVAIWSG
jgi:hypothetical protein